MAVSADDLAAKLANGMGAGGLGPSPEDSGMSGPALSDAGTPGQLPNMPAWAGWMPWDVADATQNHDLADSFGKQAISQMADTWGNIALQEGQDALNKALATAQQQVAQPAPQTPAPEQPPAPASPDSGASGQPSLQDLLTAMHGFFSNAGQAVGGAASNLGSAAQGAMSDVTGVQANAPVGPQNQGVAASAPAIQGAVQGAQGAGQAAVGAAAGAVTDPLSTGVGAINAINQANGAAQPPVPTPQEAAQQGIISPQEAGAASIMGGLAAGGPEALAAPVAGAVDLARAGAAGVRTAAESVRALGDTGLAEGLGELSVPEIAGASSDDFNMSHPLVQRVADVVGPEQAQQAVDVLNNPNRLQRILKAPSRINNDTDQIAYQIYRGSKDAGIMQAAAAGDTQTTASAVVDGLAAHNPGPDLQPQAIDPARRQEAIDQLMKTRQFSTPELAGQLVDRVGPDALLGPKPVTAAQQQLLGRVSEMSGPAGDAVVRDAARTVTGVRQPIWANMPEEAPAAAVAAPEEAPTVLPSGRVPGPVPATPPVGAGHEPVWAHIADEAAGLTPVDEPPIPPGEPPIPPPGGTGLPSGRYPGAPLPRNISLPGALRTNLPALATGTAAAAPVWTQDQNDDLWRRALLTALAFKVGSSTPYIVAGGPRAELGARAFTSFANNLLTPGTAALKGLTDVGSVLTNPGFNFVRSLASGNDLRVAGSEILPYYSSLLKGNGFREGLQGAMDALNPAIPMAGKGARAATASTPGLAEVASTNNLRLINAIARFWEPVMAEAEQAGMSAADIAARNQGNLGAIGNSARVGGEVSPMAIDRAHSGMMMGEPEGVVGRALMPAFQAIQRAGSVGKFIEPFANIPANLIDRGISSMPLVGVLNTIGAKAPGAVLARQALGLTAFAIMRGMFQTSGNGPSDPVLNKQWRDEGNVPNSVKLPWSDSWVPINRVPLMPLRGALEFDNALTDVKLNGADQSVAAKFATSFGQSVASEAFLPNLIQLAVAAQKGDFSGVPSTLGSTVRSLVPEEARLMAKAEQGVKPDTTGKALRPAGAQLTDKAGAAIQAQVQANVPRGVGVPAPQPALDAAGQPIPNNQTGASVVAPLAPSKPAADPVVEAFNGAGVPIPAVPTTLSVNGRDMELDGAAQQQFSQVRGDFLRTHMPATLTAIRAQSLLDQARSAAEQDFARNSRAAVQSAPTSQQKKQGTQQAKAAAWGNWGSVSPPPLPSPSTGTAATPSAAPSAPPATKTTNWGTWGK